MENLEVKPTDWVNYYQLKKGDIILPDDEVYDDDKKGWRKTVSPGRQAPDPLYPAHDIYRRKRKSE